MHEPQMDATVVPYALFYIMARCVISELFNSLGGGGGPNKRATVTS